MITMWYGVFCIELSSAVVIQYSNIDVDVTNTPTSLKICKLMAGQALTQMCLAIFVRSQTPTLCDIPYATNINLKAIGFWQDELEHGPSVQTQCWNYSMLALIDKARCTVCCMYSYLYVWNIVHTYIDALYIHRNLYTLQ